MYINLEYIKLHKILGFLCLLFKYIFGCTGVCKAHRLQQLPHTGSVVAARRLQNVGSVVVAHGPSCSMACGIFPDQSPCPLHWQVDSYPLYHQGSPFAFFFIYFWLCWVFVAAWLFSACREWGLLSCSVQVLVAVASIVAEHRLQGFSRCSMWPQQLWFPGSRAQAQQLWHMDLVAPWHVGSYQTRDQTLVSSIGGWIL